MKQNPNKKEFTFEKKLYKAVDEFIAEDTAAGNNNFSEEYCEAMNTYRKLFNKEFCGMRYKMPLFKSRPGMTVWNHDKECDINFGNIWETEANSFIRDCRSIYGYKAWPNKITEFPDFREDAFVGDYKSGITKLYADTPANRTRKLPIGYLTPGCAADLYKISEYEQDIETYRTTGKLSDHLTALIVYALYEYKYDETTGEKYAIVYNVIVAPAIFCINFLKDGGLQTRSGKITIGFQERNIDNIMHKNFGI